MTESRKATSPLFETHYANQLIGFLNLDTLEIDKRLRPNVITTLVWTETYCETFIYVTSSPTEDFEILEKGTFMT